MYRVFEHGQVVLSALQCMYAIHEASPQSHELYCDDPNRLGRRQLQLDDQSVFRFSLCGNKKAKYDDNVPLLIFHFSTKTTRPIKNLFLPIDS